MREALDAGAVFNEGSGPIASANLNIVQISEAGGGGNRASYLARRIARDRPDMLPAMAAGEYKSIHDAVRAEMVRVVARQAHALQEVGPVTAKAADGVNLSGAASGRDARGVYIINSTCVLVGPVRRQPRLPDRVPDRALVQADRKQIASALLSVCHPSALLSRRDLLVEVRPVALQPAAKVRLATPRFVKGCVTTFFRPTGTRQRHLVGGPDGGRPGAPGTSESGEYRLAFRALPGRLRFCSILCGVVPAASNTHPIDSP